MNPIPMRRALVTMGLVIVSGSVALLPRLASAERTAVLTVRVIDETGAPISGARVNVYQENVFLHRRGVVVPHQYEELTGADGLARLQIKAPEGGTLDLALEVAREDKETHKRDVSPGREFPPRLPLETVTLRKKSAAGSGPVIDVGIEVRTQDGAKIEGARVEIRDTDLGAATGRFFASTGADGRATVSVLYASADPQNYVDLSINKNGYKPLRQVIELRAKDVRKAVVGGEFFLEKATETSTNVAIKVIDKKTRLPVADASVVLDGPTYVSETTNSNGVAQLLVAERGGFAVRITHDSYRDYTDALRLSAGEQAKSETYEVEAKAKKNGGDDKIEVTVLARDPTDEKSKPVPLPGATVRAGTVSAPTDGTGVAVLTGAFDESQEISVQASGYKPHTHRVAVSKILHYSRGSGKATITLDPELSENSAIRLIVEVRDENGPVKGANVDFMMPPERYLFGGVTGNDGKRDFRSGDAADVTVAELRKGLVVNVKATGYKEVRNRAVPSELLQPKMEARLFTVQLDRDWAELEAALAALEGRVAAWANDLGLSPDAEAETKARALGEQADKVSDEITSAAPRFGIVMGPGPAVERCRKATELRERISAAENEANQRAEELKRLLAAAETAANTCSGPNDPTTVRGNYQDAIKLLGEIGVRNKNAVKAREDLVKLADESLGMKRLVQELEGKASALEQMAASATEVAAAANHHYEQQREARATLVNRQAALKGEVARLQQRYPRDTIPSKLQAKIDALRARLDTSNVVQASTPKKPSQKVTGAAESIRLTQTRVKQTLDIYRRAACDVDTVPQTLDAIDSTFREATMEVGLAANLPAQAVECAKKLAAADEVTVPDLAGLADLNAMRAAASQAGLTPAIAATSATPPPGTTRLFAGQDPPPNTKARKGSPLKILLYQKLAQAAEEVSVPDLSGNDVPQMKAALAGAGLVGAFSAQGKPPSKAQEFKFAGQSPAAGTKVKRGTAVSVSIYQKFDDATAATKDTVSVPAIFTGNTAEVAKSALSSVGLSAAFNAKGGRPATKEQEFKTTGALDPPAGTKVPRGSTVTVSLYQKHEDSVAQNTPTAPPLGPSSSSAMPNLIGMTLDQAVGKLPAGMRIGSTEMGDKPPSPEKALTIFAQSPGAGTPTDRSKEVVVKVKLYGSSRTASDSTESGDPFTGIWVGKHQYGGTGDEMTISKQGAQYAILAKGKEFAHSANSDGIELSHQFGIYQISYRRVGELLECNWSYQPLRGAPVTGQTTFRRK